MARQCELLLVCALAVLAGRAQAISEKTILGEALLGARLKNGAVSSHLQRILQVEPELEMEEPKEPASTTLTCSPAALKPQRDCLAPSRAVGSKLAINDGSTCLGDDCIVAPMPGSVGAPKRGDTAMEDRSPLPEALHPLMHGPMTQQTYERMVMRKRAALRAKLQAQGQLTDFLDAYLKEAPTTYDASGIPMPAEPAKAKKADFEMRFKPQSPAPAPRDGSAKAAAAKPSADFTMEFAPAAPSPAPYKEQDRKAAGAGGAAASPEPAGAWMARERLRAATAAALKESARLMDEAAVRSKAAAAAGPGRPPMTEEEAAKLGPQVAGKTNLAAAAAAARRRATADAALKLTSAAAKAAAAATLAAELEGLEYGNMPAASSASSGGVMEPPKELLERPPLKPAAAAATALSADALYDGPELAAHHRRRVSEIERVLMVEEPASAAAGDAAKPAAKPADAKASSESATAARRRAAAEADAARRKRATVAAMQQQQRRASAAAAAALSGAPRWTVLDYVCAAALLCLVPVAVFMAAAVLEEVVLPSAPNGNKATGRPQRQAGTPLLLHWFALTHYLWRRTRRAFAAARKQLTGHASDLPTCANEGSTTLARSFNAAAAIAHVFWAHLSDLRLPRSSGGAASPAASSGGSSTASSCGEPSGNPFSGLAAAAAAASTGGASRRGSQTGEAVVVQADDTATATAMAELQLRRRH